jgi:hypothetical protein
MNEQLMIFVMRIANLLNIINNFNVNMKNIDLNNEIIMMHYKEDLMMLQGYANKIIKQ